MSVDTDASAGAHEEQDEPDLERALAAEAVAERAGGEQQARRTRASRRRPPTGAATRWRRSSRDSVGIATLRLELPTKTISEAQAQDGERPPAPVVEPLDGRIRRRMHGSPGDGSRGRSRGRSGSQLPDRRRIIGTMLPLEAGSRMTESANAPSAPTPGATASGCSQPPRRCSPSRGSRRRSRRSPAGPAWASARCAATSRPSRRWSRRCSTVDVRVAPEPTPTTALGHPDPGAAFEQFFVALPEFQARHRALAEQMAKELELPTSAQPLREELMPRARGVGGATRRPPARSAPTSGRPTCSMLFSGVAHATALAGELQPVLRERYVRIILDGLRPTDASPLPGRPLDFAQLRRMKQRRAK